MALRTRSATFMTLILFALTATASPAMAQTSAPRQGSDKETVVYDFPADIVRGARDSPDGGSVTGELPRPQPSLIKLRRHFVDELIVSAEDL